MYKLIEKSSKEIVRIEVDRFHYDKTKYELVEYDPVARREQYKTAILAANLSPELTKILKNIIKDLI